MIKIPMINPYENILQTCTHQDSAPGGVLLFFMAAIRQRGVHENQLAVAQFSSSVSTPHVGNIDVIY